LPNTRQDQQTRPNTESPERAHSERDATQDSDEGDESNEDAGDVDLFEEEDPVCHKINS
jgi:hypothetical protein